MVNDQIPITRNIQRNTQHAIRSTKIKALLFDVGETLLNFGKFDASDAFAQAAQATYEFLKHTGQPVGGFKYYYWRNFVSLRLRCLFSNIIGRDFDSLALMKKVGTKKGIHLTEQQWQHFGWLWYEPLTKIAETEADIVQTLTKLKNHPLKLGIVSNTFVSAFAIDKHLDQLGLLEFFPVRVYSYRFKFRKPDMKIFYTAAEQLAEKPADIMFIGDRIDTDIDGALKAGMHTVLKKAYTNNNKKPPHGVYKINILAELPTLIEKINAD